MEQCFGKTVFREGMDIVRSFFLYGFHNAVTGIEQKHNDYALTQMILKKIIETFNCKYKCLLLSFSQDPKNFLTETLFLGFWNLFFLPRGDRLLFR